ncbi:MAG: methyltransferase domain-containing protein [Betaproteobacteria bacterium]|nr:MAG: methyltransferase domain-containing protein [Betaproteobacteria bacterium]
MWASRESWGWCAGRRWPPSCPRYYADPSRRRAFVSNLFDDTAKHYDWIIKVMSFGSGNRYRKEALLRAGLRPGMHVIDVASGTGPVSRSEVDIVGPHGSVVSVDRSYNMLDVARKSVPTPGIQASAEDLPFPDNQFDFLSMGYALRHVDDLNDTFAEYRRVLKPGGSVLIMELTPPKSAIGRRFVKFYLNSVVPTIARIGTRSDDARTLMKYFWDTIDSCVPPQSILDAMKRSGFADVSCHCISGVFREYVGRKP